MKPRIVLGAIIAIATFLLATWLPRMGVHRAAWANICDLVVEKFYRDDQGLQDWYSGCRDSASRVPWWWTRHEVLRQIQFKLDELEVSHLAVFDPEEDRRLWRGEAVDSGLRLWQIDGRWIVSRVLTGSVAEQADVRAGDELLSLDGEPLTSEWTAQTSSGTFRFQRGEQTLDVILQASTLQIDRMPQLKAVKPSVGWLEISSFRGEYFKEEDWRKLVGQFASYSHLIVDLRDNAGGNLVSMLRALSPFLCSVKTVGELSQPRRSIEKGPPPPDNLDDMAQLNFLEQYQSVPLRTFDNYGCYRGRVTVLINGSSASVSEIFAHAMLARQQTRVWGRPSAGDVLIGTWYFLPIFGPGYSLSIPEAVYLTTNQESLEGGGVWPQESLDYKIDEALAGQDSWILRAAEK